MHDVKKCFRKDVIVCGRMSLLEKKNPFLNFFNLILQFTVCTFKNVCVNVGMCVFGNRDGKYT